MDPSTFISAMDNLCCEPEVVLTKRLKTSIETVQESKSTEEPLRKELKKYLDGDAIPFRLVEAVYRSLSESDEEVYLHEMMEGSGLVLPKYEPPPRDPVLEARCQKLKNEQDNLKYEDMVRNVSRKKQDAASAQGIGGDMKELNKQLITVLNFVLTVLGSFAFAYKATEYAFSGFGNVFGLQLMAGLTVATVVFFADLYFLMKYET